MLSALWSKAVGQLEGELGFLPWEMVMEGMDPLHLPWYQGIFQYLSLHVQVCVELLAMDRSLSCWAGSLQDQPLHSQDFQCSLQECGL